MVSCNEGNPVEASFDKEMPRISVVPLSSYLPESSRANDTSSDDQTVLRFQNREAYEQTIQELKTMSEPERLEFFENLGFTGAYTLITIARNDLDAIFDAYSDEIAKPTPDVPNPNEDPEEVFIDLEVDQNVEEEEELPADYNVADSIALENEIQATDRKGNKSRPKDVTIKGIICQNWVHEKIKR